MSRPISVLFKQGVYTLAVKTKHKAASRYSFQRRAGGREVKENRTVDGGQISATWCYREERWAEFMFM